LKNLFSSPGTAATAQFHPYHASTKILFTLIATIIEIFQPPYETRHTYKDLNRKM